MRIPAVCILVTLAALSSACQRQAPSSASLPQSPLHVTELSPGEGEPIVTGRTAVVDYTGWLYDANAPDHRGRVFDSSRASGRPLHFELGAGQVIAGWDQGVTGMRVHGRRELTIPPDLAYGASGAGGVIPPHATLVFDVELLAIQ
jgi:FKBP-type peptidyl-prolyl cis-trans isomerase FkpA